MRDNHDIMIEDQTAAEKLAAALSNGRFVLYRQLIAPLGWGAMEPGFHEILIRFLDEEEGLLPPGGFFPTLERCGLMFTLDCWVVDAVIKWLAAGQASPNSHDLPCCSMNLSAQSISNAALPRFVSARVQEAGIPSGKIIFEIPESDAAAYAIAVEELIRELAAAGCGFSLTGYSGKFAPPQLLQALGIKFVKIDGRIIQNIHRDTVSLATARDISNSCRRLGIRTVGELVELPETVQKLTELGVDYAQGHGIAKPEPLI